jgi:hypothetical protein
MKNRYGRLGALVYDLDKPIGRSFGDIEFYKERFYCLLQRKSRVIRAYRDAHRSPRFRDLPPLRVLVQSTM